MDLHSFLSSSYSDSVAEAIDENGNIAGHATYIPTGQQHAILWSVVPSLTISRAEQNVVLSWPTNASGFTLQSALNVNPPINWIDCTNVPAIVGTQCMVTNIASNAFQFYRLKK
jgi:hypothetical protein